GGRVHRRARRRGARRAAPPRPRPHHRAHDPTGRGPRASLAGGPPAARGRPSRSGGRTPRDGPGDVSGDRAGGRDARRAGHRIVCPLGRAGGCGGPRATLDTRRNGVVTGPTNVVRSLHQDLSDRPFIVIWEVTRACALACRHCRAEAQPQRHPLELSTAEGKAFLEDLASLGATRPMIVLTGGDPVESPDLVELVAHGTSLGLPVSIAPSVTPRLRAPVLSELRRAGARTVS